jgi:hypothetical protein
LSPVPCRCWACGGGSGRGRTQGSSCEHQLTMAERERPRAHSRLTWPDRAWLTLLAGTVPAECLAAISSARRECLDLMLITSRRHLRQVLSEYVEHYNVHRPHGPGTCDHRTATAPSRPRSSIRRRKGYDGGESSGHLRTRATTIRGGPPVLPQGCREAHWRFVTPGLPVFASRSAGRRARGMMMPSLSNAAGQSSRDGFGAMQV